jgi:predicted transcriptional regulator
MRTRCRTDLHVALSHELRDKVSLLAKHQHVPMSAIAEAAMEAYVSDQETTDLRRAVLQQTRAVAAVANQVRFLTELTGLVFELLMANLRDIPATELDEAKRRKDRRYAQTVKTLQQRLTTHTTAWQLGAHPQGEADDHP